MKKLIAILLSALSLMSFKAVPKLFTIATVVVCSNSAEAQNPAYLNAGINTTDVTYEVYMLYFPYKKITVWKDTTDFSVKTNNIHFDSLNSRRNNGVPTSIAWFGSDGKMNRSPITSMTLTSSQITAALGFTPSSGGGLSSVTGSTGISVTNGSVITNTIPDRTVSITAGNGISTTSSYPNFTISLAARTMTTVIRSLVTSTASTGYQISSTLDYNVNYSVYAQVTSALAGTNTADVYLEISPNNSTWTTISRSGISIGGIVSTSGNTQTVGGFVPAGYYVRIRTSATGANSASAVFTYQQGQENNY